jgi:hypothetical protein
MERNRNLKTNESPVQVFILKWIVNAYEFKELFTQPGSGFITIPHPRL